MMPVPPPTGTIPTDSYVKTLRHIFPQATKSFFRGSSLSRSVKIRNSIPRTEQPYLPQDIQHAEFSLGRNSLAKSNLSQCVVPGAVNSVLLAETAFADRSHDGSALTLGYFELSI